MRQKQSEKERQTLDWIVACSKKAPDGLEDISCHNMVRMVRNRLGMTQEQLARRVGLPQSHIAKIECGKVDIQISTMKRIFKSLYCEPIMLPRPVKEINVLIRDRVGVVAERNVAKATRGKYAGRRSIEKLQHRRMLQEEKWKLLQDLSSDIWND